MKMESSWRFDTPGAMPPEVVREFDTLIGKVVSQGNRWRMHEHFKGYFGGSGRSSSESWAESDLNDWLWRTAENAPLFIEAFYETCEASRGDDSIALPDVGRMNRILGDHAVGYEIRPPELVAVGLHQPIAVPERYQSLDEQAQEGARRPKEGETRAAPEGPGLEPDARPIRLGRSQSREIRGAMDAFTTEKSRKGRKP
jgi:hypothetical protein